MNGGPGSELPAKGGEHAHPDAHWAAEAVDLDRPCIPSLKARFLIEHLPDEGTVCEIGCGDGKLLRTAAQRKPKLVLHGCDVRVPRTPPDVYRFARVEGERLPYADGALDVVIVFDVLEHVLDPAATLREAARVLRPGGRLVSFIPVEGERLSFYEVYRRLLGRDTYARTKEHLQAFTHAEVRAVLATRFTILEARYAYHFLGQLMDASFFAAARLRVVRDFWWRDNVYYNAPRRGEGSARGAASAMLNALLELGNMAAYAESTLLARTPITAAGVMVDARVRKGSGAE